LLVWGRISASRRFSRENTGDDLDQGDAQVRQAIDQHSSPGGERGGKVAILK
jgi:hypothetical protein